MLHNSVFRCWGVQRSLAAAAAADLPKTYLCVATQYRSMNVNRSVQTKWEMDSMTSSQKRTDYDFDKEQWMKQMRFASMDCIMDTNITPIRYTSLSGVGRAFRRFVTMKKLKDRRPDFDKEQLIELFVQFKSISRDGSMDNMKVLQRLTTHGEADRIAKEIRSRMNANFANKSWRALKQQNTVNTYAIELDTFDLVNCYMGQMAQDDWLQITYRCEYREREDSTSEWTKAVEYPVFEVRLGDGVRSASVYPFIIVGIMRKDGTRYGKDSQDAETLRKQFDRAKRWF